MRENDPGCFLKRGQVCCRNAGGGNGVHEIAHEDGATYVVAVPPISLTAAIVHRGVVDFAVHGKGAIGLVHLHKHQFGNVFVRPRVPAVFVKVNVAVGGQRHGEHGFWRPVLERLRFVRGFRGGPHPHVRLVLEHRGKPEGGGLLRIGWVGDVEERYLCSRPVQARAVFVGRSKTNRQQVVSGEWVNVGGDTWNLQFPKDGWVGFIGDIDDPQRVDLFERDEVGPVTIKASGPNPLAGRNAVDLPRFNQHLPVGLHIDRPHERNELG